MMPEDRLIQPRLLAIDLSAQAVHAPAPRTQLSADALAYQL
jgi:hypothetical protein